MVQLLFKWLEYKKFPIPKIIIWSSLPLTTTIASWLGIIEIMQANKNMNWHFIFFLLANLAVLWSHLVEFTEFWKLFEVWLDFGISRRESHGGKFGVYLLTFKLHCWNFFISWIRLFCICLYFESDVFTFFFYMT